MKKVVVLIVILVFFLIPIIPQFTISNGLNGKIVFFDKLNSFQEFYISFVHSVNKTTVNEYYKIKDKEFVLDRTDFYSFGAGMPDGSDNPNAELHFNEDGLVEISNINKEFDKITYYVGTFADHTLHAGNNNLRLVDIMEPKTPAEIKIKRVSIFTIIRRCFNERRFAKEYN